jgi:hypothetical protein
VPPNHQSIVGDAKKERNMKSGGLGRKPKKKNENEN